MALPPCLLVSLGRSCSQCLGCSPTLGLLGPSQQRRYKSWVLLRDSPCAHAVLGTPHGVARNNMSNQKISTHKNLYLWFWHCAWWNSNKIYSSTINDVFIGKIIHVHLIAYIEIKVSLLINFLETLFSTSHIVFPHKRSHITWKCTYSIGGHYLTCCKIFWFHFTFLG